MKRFLTVLVLMAGLATGWSQFGSFYSDQPFLAADRAATSSDSLITAYTNLFRFWTSTDLPYASVSTWTDKVVSQQLVQPETAKQPTNTPSGIYFNGATYFTNTICDPNPGLDRTNMFMVILNCTNVAVDNAVFTAIRTGGSDFDGFTVGRNSHWFIYWDYPQPVHTAPYIADNTIYDVIWQGPDVYTNGVLSVSNTVRDYLYYMDFQNVGRRQDDAWLFRGYIMDIIIWTNTYSATRQLDSGTLSNLHYYATNKYKFTP